MPGPIRNLVRVLGILSLVAATSMDMPAQETAESESANEQGLKKPLYFVFLTSGKSSEGMDPNEVQKMQAAHLANFGRLAGLKQLLTAGPLADPEKRLRGIVVVTSPDAAGLRKLFEPDPYIQSGMLKIEASPMHLAVGELRTTVTPESLEEFSLVLLQRSSPDRVELSDEDLARNADYCRSIHDADRLRLAAWFDATDLEHRGVLIFRKLEADQLQPLVSALPAVQSGDWTAKPMSLFMGKGTLD